MANKFKKGNRVIVIAGSDKGKSSNIISIKNRMVLLEGLNLATIHKKPNSNNLGHIIKLERRVHISNISHVEAGKPIKSTFYNNSITKKDFKAKTLVSKKTGKKVCP